MVPPVYFYYDAIADMIEINWEPNVKKIPISGLTGAASSDMLRAKARVGIREYFSVFFATVKLNYVLNVPNVNYSLVSVSRLCDKGQVSYLTKKTGA